MKSSNDGDPSKTHGHVPVRPWGEPSSPAPQSSAPQSPYSPPPSPPPPASGRRFPVLSVLFAILLVAGVGVRAWQELSEPSAWSYWKDAYLEPSLSAQVVRIGPPDQARTVLAVSGAIGAAAAQWFRDQVNDAGLKPGDLILLSSPGGVVDQGLIMGEVIRARGLSTADTKAAMKDYLSSFDPHLKGLTGDPDAMAKVISEFRVYAKKVPLKDGDYTMDHTALIYLMDRDGKFVSPFRLDRKPEEAAADLKRYL